MLDPPAKHRPSCDVGSVGSADPRCVRSTSAHLSNQTGTLTQPVLRALEILANPGAAGGRRFTASSRASMVLAAASNERLLLVERGGSRKRSPTWEPTPPLTPLSRPEDARSLEGTARLLEAPRPLHHGRREPYAATLAGDAFVLSPASIARRFGTGTRRLLDEYGPNANGLDDATRHLIRSHSRLSVPRT